MPTGPGKTGRGIFESEERRGGFVCTESDGEFELSWVDGVFLFIARC